MAESPQDERQNDLDARLKAARRRHGLDGQSGGKPVARSIGIAARSGVEFMAAIVVSAGLGLLIDRWLHCSPFALLGLLTLGFAAGLLNVYRAMNDMPYAATYKSRKAEPDEQDES